MIVSPSFLWDNDNDVTRVRTACKTISLDQSMGQHPLRSTLGLWPLGDLLGLWPMDWLWDIILHVFPPLLTSFQMHLSGSFKIILAILIFNSFKKSLFMSDQNTSWCTFLITLVTYILESSILCKFMLFQCNFHI